MLFRSSTGAYLHVVLAMLLAAGNSDATKYAIAVVPKLTGSPFFDLVGDGCSQLSAVIDDLILEGVHGIAVAVLDRNITGAAIDRAVDAGIPVVTFDADAPNSKRSVTISTDNFEVGHGLAWLLSLSGPQGGRFAVISSNVVNVNQRVDGLRFKLQESFPNNNWLEFGDATDCQDDVETSLDQAFEIASNPEVNAIVSVGGWPMFNPTRWKQFVDENPDLLLIVVDSLPTQLDLLEEGYADALLGQRPLEMGKRNADSLYSLISDPGYSPQTQMFTGVEVFLGNRNPSTDSTGTSSSAKHQRLLTTVVVALSLVASGFMM